MSQEPLRLSKLMADLGICSRREADHCIENGWVKVDGQVVDQLGTKVLPDVNITLSDDAEKWIRGKLSIIINKPVGHVSGQAEEDYENASALLTLENQVRSPGDSGPPTRSQMMTLAPAGRLDIDSWGLLILTQDGRIARAVISPQSVMTKEYLVWVDGIITPSRLQKLRHGLSLDNKPLLPAEVEIVKDNQLRFVLQEGKKRQIRRMCELVDLEVTNLLRTRIGPIQLGNLQPNQWRHLSRKEIFALLKNEEEKSNAYTKTRQAGGAQNAPKNSTTDPRENTRPTGVRKAYRR